jgi:predicted ester cyclase
MATEATKRNRNETFAKMAIEVLNTGNVDVLDEIARPDFVDHDPELGQGPGLEGLKIAFRRFRMAFPDLRLGITHVFSSGDHVIVRSIMEGTNTGELLPGVPPTKRPMRLPVIDVFRFENGRAVERWGEYDKLDMMTQLGLVPPLRA